MKMQIFRNGNLIVSAELEDTKENIEILRKLAEVNLIFKENKGELAK